MPSLLSFDTYILNGLFNLWEEIDELDIRWE